MKKISKKSGLVKARISAIITLSSPKSEDFP